MNALGKLTTTNDLHFEARVAGRPCSANRMWRIAGPTRRGQKRRMYMTDAAAAWELAMICDVREQMDYARVGNAWRQADRPRIAVTLTFYGVRGDIDNYGKCTLDGLKQALEIDDKHFSPITLRLGDKRDGRFHAAAGALIEVVIPQPTPAQVDTWQPDTWQPLEPGSLRPRDLVDVEALERLAAPPVERVTIYPAPSYGCVVIMFPANPLAERDAEWGGFVPLEHARQLRDALNALPLLNARQQSQEVAR